jgi:hypothetical protein
MTKLTFDAIINFGAKGIRKVADQVDDIKDDLKQADRLSRNLSDTKTGKSAMGAADMDTPTYRRSRSIEGRRGGARNFSGLLGGESTGTLVGAYAELAANVFALTAAFSALSQAARVEQLTQGLEILGARGGIALKLTAQNLRDVTDNAISTADAMRAVAQAASAGLGASEIERLGKVARGASLALGRDASESMDRLTRGAIKLEPELLDELGIMVRLDEAVKEFAQQNNKAASALTLTERRQAFLNAVLEEGERKFGDINDQIASNPFDRLAASARDFATAFGGVVNNFLGPIANFVADNPFALVIPAIFLATKALKGLGFAAGLSGIAIDKLFNTEIDRFTDDLFGSGDAMDKLKVGIRELEVTNIDELKDAFTEARIAVEAKEGKMTSAQYSAYLYDKTITTLKARLKLFLLTLRAVAAQLLMMAVQMLAITALIATATAAYKFFEKNVLGLTEELKEQRKVFKELGEAADETAKQVTMMLEPGKRLEGEAFDAVVTSIREANAALDEYIVKQRLAAIGEEQRNETINLGTFKILSTTATGIDSEEAAREQAARMGILGRSQDYRVVEETTNLNEVYESMESSIKNRLDLEANEEKVMVGQLKVAMSMMSLEDKQSIAVRLRNASEEERLHIIQEIFNSTEGINALYKDGLQTTKEISKNVKGFYPKETKNELEDLAQNFRDINALITQEVPGFLDGPALRASADIYLDNATSIGQTVTALQAQGYEIQKNVAIERQLLTIRRLEKDLRDAEERGFPEIIAARQVALDAARESLGVVVREEEAYLDQVATLTVLESQRESILNLQKKSLDLASKNVAMEGKASKFYAEQLQTLRDIQYAATGAEITFPKEATLEYRLQIAQIELGTAQKVADIKKRSVEIESALEAVKIRNALAENQRKIGELVPQLDLSLDSLGALLFNPIDETGALLSFDKIRAAIQGLDSTQQQLVLERYQAAANTQALNLIQQNVSLAQEQADISVVTAQNTVNRLLAEKASINEVLKLAKLDKVRLANSEKLADAASARFAALSGNVALENQFIALLETRRLPALNNEQTILGEQLSAARALLATLEASDDPDREEKIRTVNQRIDALENENSVLQEQINTINQVNASYANGLLAQQTALQNRKEELALVKSIADAQKKYNEAAADLSRSRIELGARREFRDLSAGEEQQIEAEAAQLKIENALADREMMIAEYALRRSNAELEHDLLMYRMNNEIQADRARLAAEGKTPEQIEQELSPLTNYVAQAQDNFGTSLNLMDRAFQMQLQTSDMTIQTMLNDLGHLLNVALPNTLTGMADTLFDPDGKLNPDSLAAALQNTITNAVDNVVSDSNVTPKTPAELFQGRVDEQMGRMRRSAGEQLSTTLQGFTGQARDFYTREMRKPDVDPERIRKAAVEMQTLQLATEGFNDVMNTVRSSIEDAFIAILDGSKSAKEAFADMARAILKQIIQMIVKMLVTRFGDGYALQLPIGPTVNTYRGSFTNRTDTEIGIIEQYFTLLKGEGFDISVLGDTIHVVALSFERRFINDGISSLTVNLKEYFN